MRVTSPMSRVSASADPADLPPHSGCSALHQFHPGRPARRNNARDKTGRPERYDDGRIDRGVPIAAATIIFVAKSTRGGSGIGMMLAWKSFQYAQGRRRPLGSAGRRLEAQLLPHPLLSPTECHGDEDGPERIAPTRPV